jgi:hypothetical protein
MQTPEGGGAVRTKEFEPEVALTRALDLFWERGYEKTSLQDLVDRMGWWLLGRGGCRSGAGAATSRSRHCRRRQDRGYR